MVDFKALRPETVDELPASDAGRKPIDPSPIMGWLDKSFKAGKPSRIVVSGTVTKKTRNNVSYNTYTGDVKEIVAMLNKGGQMKNYGIAIRAKQFDNEHVELYYQARERRRYERSETTNSENGEVTSDENVPENAANPQ